MNLNAILGVSFLAVGCAATLLMYHLWGYPYDAKRHVSSAPRSLTQLHRVLGLAFLGIYIVMLVRMLPRLWAFEGELPARSVLHIALAFLIGGLLMVKVFIIRFARHLGNALPHLGTAVLVCAFVMLAMPLTLSTREAWLARQAQQPEPQGRARAALLSAPEFFVHADRHADATSLIATGRALMLSRCLQCHDLRRIIQHRRPAEEWIGLVERMAKHSQQRKPIAPREAEYITLHLIAARGQDLSPAPPVSPSPRAPSAVQNAHDETAATPSRAAAAEGDNGPSASSRAQTVPAQPSARSNEVTPADGSRSDAPRSAASPPSAQDVPSIRASSPTSAPDDAPGPGTPAAPPAGTSPDFAAVQQIIEAHCIMCHKGPRAPKGLELDTPDHIFAARAGRPVAVVPGDPESSELHRRITGESTPRMPMTGPPWLSDDEIETIRAWIEAGAKTDAAAPVQPRRPQPATAPANENAPPARKPAVEGVTFADIRPVLAMNCVRCHAAQGIRGGPPEGLILGDLESILRAPERAVLIPGNPEASMLLRHIRGLEEPRMPHDGPPWLTDEEVTLITRWIREGARDEQGKRSPVPVGHEVRYEGTLTARWAVDGIPFRITRNTEVRDSPRIGDRIEVRAVISEDGSLEAERVRER